MKHSLTQESTLLIVDDDDLLLDNIEYELGPTFASILKARDGFEALQQLKLHRVDCVVTDFQMPKMNGLELISRLAVEYPQTPVLLLTGNGNHPDVLAALENGLFDFLDKPFRLPVLLNRIRNALLLPELQSLLIELVGTELPEAQKIRFSRMSYEEKLKAIEGYRAILRTRLLNSNRRRAG